MGLVEEGGFEERGRRAYNCHTISGTDDECNQDFHRKQDVSPLCRLCGDKDATRNHLICECSKMDYPQRHNKIIHQVISKKHI